MPDAIWITWENQIRNRSLSDRIGAELHVFVSKRSRLLRYAKCAYRSLRVIADKRPSVVFASNPSIVLAHLLLLFRRVFDYRLVLDAHYAGVVAPRTGWLQKALDYCNRRADLVIVTNDAHCEYVRSIGGRALVCEDPLPDISKYAKTVNEESKDVFVISSFDVDEPYYEIFKAANLLKKQGYVFWASGNFRKVGIRPSDWAGVRFLGYLPEPEFYTSLGQSQIVIDLTEQENCLVCGAYEAMMLEKPLVASKTRAMQSYFNSGTVFVDHRAQAIADGVRRAHENRRELKLQIKDWKRQAAITNARKIEAIRAFLNFPER